MAPKHEHGEMRDAPPTKHTHSSTHGPPVATMGSTANLPNPSKLLPPPFPVLSHETSPPSVTVCMSSLFLLCGSVTLYPRLMNMNTCNLLCWPWLHHMMYYNVCTALYSHTSSLIIPVSILQPSKIDCLMWWRLDHLLWHLQRHFKVPLP